MNVLCTVYYQYQCNVRIFQPALVPIIRIVLLKTQTRYQKSLLTVSNFIGSTTVLALHQTCHNMQSIKKLS